MSKEEVDLKHYEVSAHVEADVTISMREALKTLNLKELMIVRAIVRDMIVEQEWEQEEKKPDSIFCTNCGLEVLVEDLKFTICPETNHVMGVCLRCNWNEFTVDNSDLIFPEDYEWSVYPKPKFYLEV